MVKGGGTGWGFGAASPSTGATKIQESLFWSHEDQFVKQGTNTYKNNRKENSNWTFIALNLPKQEDSKAQYRVLYEML